MKKTLLTALLALVIAALSGCTDYRKKEASSASSDGVPTAVLGLKSGDQLLDAMSAITGIDRTTPAISSRYDLVVSNIIQDGTSANFSNGNFTAYMGVAVPYCQELVRREASAAPSARKFYAPVDFTRGPDALSQSARADISRTFAKAVLDRDPSGDELSAMVQCMSEAEATATNVRDVVICPCVLTFTSIEFLVI